MNLLNNLPQFMATAFFLAMIPGQGTAMIMRQTLLFGRKVGIISLIFYLTGFVIWGLFSAVGLSTIFTSSDLAYEILKWLGVSYLTFLSLQTLFKLRNGLAWYLLLLSAINKAANLFMKEQSRKLLTLISAIGLLILAALLAIS